MMPESSAKLMFVAGENSGDQHAARLIEELQRLEPRIECFGYGGESMEKAGMRLDENLAQKLPIIGFTQAFRNLGELKKLLVRAVKLLDHEKPDAVVLVDYPGFNLRVAAAAKARNIPVIYYISPQIWAWHRERLNTIAACVTRMLVILPFEEDIYRKAGVPVTYVGHPLLDQAGSGLKPRKVIIEELEIGPDKTIIGLLPGSREPEIVRHLPVMLEAARLILARWPAAEFVLPRASTISRKLIWKYLPQFPDVKVRVAEKDHQAVRAAMDFAICKSGTSTLELALLGVPMIVIYKVSLPTYLLGRMLVRIKWLGLVNIVANESVAPELIQSDATPGKISKSVLKYLRNPAAMSAMKEKLGRIRAMMGLPGASRRAAREIMGILHPPA
ncbi:MAG: lipid-A-disaccharide synthase [Candidatus Sumerlaeota bacterium]|nr:lipid-A-disaccharide synthase [Candidatus Sumerlaeota bacterium]